MKDFLYLFKGGDHSTLSPDEMQKHMQEWGAWMENLGKAGKFKGGDPLEDGGKIVSGKTNKVVTDGPFPEAKELVGGYLIVQAESVGEAAEMAKGCPGLLFGCTVEVRPIKKM